MSRWDIVIAHQQKRVLDGFTDYWKQSNYGESLHLRVFSQRDTLRHYLRLKPGIHMLVAEPEILQEVTQEDVDGILVMVLSTEDRSMECAFPYIVENPYQPLSRLFRTIEERCHSHLLQVAVQPPAHDCRIVGITSAGGGAGKTTVAYHLAKHAAGIGKRIFLLNVDPIQEYSLLQQPRGEADGDSASLSQLLYYLKRNQESGTRLPMPLEQYTVSLPMLGASTFEPLQMMEEWGELDRKLMQRLLCCIQASARFDLIIVEGRNEHQPFEAVWSLNGEVIWLLQDDLGHIIKSQHIFGEWMRAEDEAVRHRPKRMRLVVNRYMGTMMNRWTFREAAVSGFLPYIPFWKQIHGPEQWFQSTVFESTLANWAHNHLNLTGTDQVRGTAR